MKNACIYLTRECPNSCKYCAIRESGLNGPELLPEQWAAVFTGLRERLGVDFGLILGNECWGPILKNPALGVALVNSGMQYALYTSGAYGTALDMIVHKLGIDNVSCGVDYSASALMQVGEEKVMADTELRKSWHGLSLLLTVKEKYPNLDCQATFTISHRNVNCLETFIRSLSLKGINIGLNFVHSNLGGGFDFFPGMASMTPYHLTYNDFDIVFKVLNSFTPQTCRVQNLLDMQALVNGPMARGNVGVHNTCWHCKGDPYGGPTVDADGHLRCCGYRKGKYTNKYTIWQLLDGTLSHNDWVYLVRRDADLCPGCTWSYPRLYKQYAGTDQEQFGTQVFARHARPDVPEAEWDTRK